MNLVNWATGLEGFLMTGGVLFVLGIAAILWRRNTIGILLGIELILNAASINFIAFSKYRTAAIDGQVFALFIILIAAAEAAVALAIILRMYRLRESIDVGEANFMRN